MDQECPRRDTHGNDVLEAEDALEQLCDRVNVMRTCPSMCLHRVEWYFRFASTVIVILESP